MFGFTKAVQTAAAPQVEAAATAWGFSPTEWAALTDPQRRDYRDRIIYAGRSDSFGRTNA